MSDDRYYLQIEDIDHGRRIFSNDVRYTVYRERDTFYEIVFRDDSEDRLNIFLDLIDRRKGRKYTSYIGSMGNECSTYVLCEKDGYGD